MNFEKSDLQSEKENPLEEAKKDIAQKVARARALKGVADNLGNVPESQRWEEEIDSLAEAGTDLGEGETRSAIKYYVRQLSQEAAELANPEFGKSGEKSAEFLEKIKKTQTILEGLLIAPSAPKKPENVKKKEAEPERPNDPRERYPLISKEILALDLREGDVIVSNSGTRRVIKEISLAPSRLGGGVFLVEMEKGGVKSEEMIDFELLYLSLRQKSVKIEKQNR